ncbi:MAG TPA: 50S ribosomal protein L25, partial [Vicinamibacteria bacterium]
MPEIVVAAESRTESGKNANRRLRASGKIPGVLYGTGKAPTAVSVSPKDIGNILKSASGENTLFELEIAGSRRKVILKEFQLEPLKNRLLHADFYEVALDKAIQVKVHVELHGVPVGVKVQGGILDFVTRELEVSCLPTDIPAKFEVDVSQLELGKHLRVSDLKIPEKVVVLTEADVVVAHVVAPRAEEEVAPAAEAVAGAEAAGAEPEVIKKGKAEAEGEGDEKAEKGDKKAEKKEKK